MTHPDWLEVMQGTAPLILSLPHTGTEIPARLSDRFPSVPLALKDTDWHIERLYDFAAELGATVVRTEISRSVIDVNRDPSGAPLYPDQITTGLCPTETFEGEPLYAEDAVPAEAEIEERRATWFDPYHAALRGEIDRLRAEHPRVVLYDCHSIRSILPRLFEGTLPHINIGTNGGTSCAPEVRAIVERAAIASPFSRVVDGRFKGGWITRHYGHPLVGVHTIQVELACRAYLTEPLGPVTLEDWPPTYSVEYATPLQEVLLAALAPLSEWGAQA